MSTVAQSSLALAFPRYNNVRMNKRMTVRIPPDDKRKLRELAAIDRVSMSEIARRLIDQAYETHLSEKQDDFGQHQEKQAD